MKRNLINFALVAAAAFAMASCAQKESYAPVQEETPEYVSFEFEANLPAETKTYNDGMKTFWKENDQIKVTFTGAWTGTQFMVDNPFTYNADGKFVGTLEWEIIAGFFLSFSGGTLTAVYPFDADGTIPASTVQTGYDSMAHLAGENCPLFGTTSLNWDQDYRELLKSGKYIFPAVTLNHLSSVLEVVVTNNTASAVEVSDVDFLVDGEVKATTVVEGAGALAAGETAKVYVVVEPETYAGSQISFQVNDTFEKKVTVDGDVTFTAGKIKKVNFVLE